MQGCDDRGDRSRKRAKVRERERHANGRQTCERTVGRVQIPMHCWCPGRTASIQTSSTSPQPGASTAMPDSSSTAHRGWVILITQPLTTCGRSGRAPTCSRSELNANNCGMCRPVELVSHVGIEINTTPEQIDPLPRRERGHLQRFP